MSTLTSQLVTRDPALGGTYDALYLAVDYAGAVTCGHRWALDQHLRDVPPDEVARLAADAFTPGQEG
jgi:hypothetical protein